MRMAALGDQLMTTASEDGRMGFWSRLSACQPAHPPNRQHVNMQPFPRSHGIRGVTAQSPGSGRRGVQPALIGRPGTKMAGQDLVFRSATLG